MFEVTYAPEINIAGADATVLVKNAIQEKCIQMDGDWDTQFNIDLFPGNPDGYAGSTQFNSSLVQRHTGENAFWDGDTKDKISPVALNWIGGILCHLPALTAFCAPTPHCYTHYHSGTYCVSTAKWGMFDYTSAIRVKNMDSTSCYCENRLPSGASNPYFVMAATVAAGIDGLKRKLLVPEGLQPDSKSVPSTQEEAFKALREDSYMVEALGSEFIENYINFFRVV